MKLFLYYLFYDFFLNSFKEFKNINNLINLELNNNFYLIKFFFLNLNCNLNGGSIFFSSLNNFSIVIEYCNFFNCSSINEGGSIYFSCLNSNFVLSKCCSYNSISFNGQFFVTLSQNQQIFNFLSIYKSNNPNISSQNIFVINNGYQYFQNSNISKNYLYNWASLYFFNSIKLNSIFNNIIETTSISWIGFWTRNGNFNNTKSNFIKNFQQDSRWGFIYLDTATTIFNDCIFFNNSLFLFQVHSGTLTLNYCFIQNYSKSGTIFISFQKSLLLTHFIENLNCDFKINTLPQFQELSILFFLQNSYKQ